MSLLPFVSAGMLAAIAVVAAWSDIRLRRLPNWLCALALLTGLASGFVSGGASWLGMSALHVLLALLAGMALFATGVIGGGDAKYYAALAAWFPLANAFLLLSAVSVAGLGLLVLWLPLRRRAAAAGGRMDADSAFRKLPYGVAISAGAVIAYVIQSRPF